MSLSSPRRAYHAPIRREQAAATRLRLCHVAKTLFETHGYAQTSVSQIARVARVSAQTVYDAFGTKRGLARAVLDLATGADDVADMLTEIATTSDPKSIVSLAAQVTRRILERGSRAVEAMRRAGDDELLTEWRSWEQRRYAGQRPLIQSLSNMHALREDRTEEEALDILWALTGRDMYELLVTERRWSSEHYERWLTETLHFELLGQLAARSQRDD